MRGSTEEGAMRDEQDYLGTSDRSFRLSADVGALMLKGAAYAAVLCFVTFLAVWGLIAIAGLLPEASKQAPDPTPEDASLALPSDSHRSA